MPDWDAAKRVIEQAFAWPSDGPGGVVVLFDRDGIRAHHAAGVESLATGTPFGLNTISRCASVTKHVFASFVLAHRGTISLDSPLSRYLPRLAPETGAVTIGQALDMTGGVPDTRESLTLLGLSIFSETHAPDLLSFHTALPRLNYPAGTEVHYSNGGYRLVEEAMRQQGLEFDAFLDLECRANGLPFFAPEMWTDPLPGLATGYWHDGAGWRVGLQGMHLSAAGSLATSGRGLAEWGRLLLTDQGSFKGRLAALTARRHLADGRATDYGLGMRRQQIGRRELVGHGGSQPGYKSYLLLDPETGTGCAILANRDDINSAEIAARAMAALLGEALPEAGSDLVPGLYVTAEGADWIEVTPNTVIRLDDEVAVYPVPGGGVDSHSPTSRLCLRMDGANIIGEVGHSARRYHPASGTAIPDGLSGAWRNDFGAILTVENGDVIMGTGPNRRRMPLTALGNGRFLFTLKDGPWQRRICLHHQTPDEITLALSRARIITYRAA